MSRFAPDVLAILALGLALVFFYWGFLLGRTVIWDDTLTEFYPGVNYFAKSIKAGRFPLWLPGVRDGMPFYSDPQMAAFYPPQWLLIPFVRNGRLPFLVYQRYIVLHYFLGGVFMYAFLKHLKLSSIAALSGALVFSLSGFPSLRIVNFVMIQVYVWLPLQLFCVHRLTTGGGRWAWLGLVAAMLASLLAGHPQTTVYCWYLLTAYWLYCCYCARRNVGHDWETTMRLVGRRDLPKVAGTFALVLGLAAMMILPVTENWLRTARPQQSFDSIADTSLPRAQLLTLFVPRFFGETRNGSSPLDFWGFDPRSPTVIQTRTVKDNPGYWQYWEFGAYTGQMFWIAAFLILLNWQRIEDKQTIGFFLVAWLAALWFMLGRYGGLFQFFYYCLPGASMFRGPAKMSCVATFAAAMLCAQAIESLRRRAVVTRSWPALLPALGSACLALALYFRGEGLAAGLSRTDRLTWARHETLFVLTVGVTCALAAIGVIRARKGWARALCLYAIPFFLLVDFHHAFASFQRGAKSPDVYYPETSEMLSLVKSYHQKQQHFRFAQIVQDQVLEELVFHRNFPCFHDFFEAPEGYATFHLDTVARFQNITNRAAKLNIQNVALAVERDSQNDYWLDIITNSLPRAKFFARIRRYDSDTTLLDDLERGAIDWHNEVAVSEPLGAGAFQMLEPSNHTSTVEDEVRFEATSPESYSVEYNLSRPGIIFISQTFYPGWVANDGQVKLTRAFGAFQGLVVPVGRGRIVVCFSPRVLRFGATISLISLTIVGLVISKWRRDTVVA